jgi:hypothetical protein
MKTNPQQFTGHLKRRLRIDKHNKRAEKENQKMKAKWKSINVTWLDSQNRENKHCFIRLELKKPVIPDEGFHDDIVSVLEEVLDGHI